MQAGSGRRLYVDRAVSEESIRLTVAANAGSFHLGGDAHLHAYLTDAVGSCAGAVAELARRCGLGSPRVFEVRDAAASRPLRGVGLGAWMYAEAARLAWASRGALLTASECTDGGTSPDAARVWASARFGRWTEVEGRFAAVWRDRAGGGPARPPEPPPGVSLVFVGDGPAEPPSAAELQCAMDALARPRRPNPPKVEVVSTVRADMPGMVVAEISVYLAGRYAGMLQLSRPDEDRDSSPDLTWPWPWSRRREDDEQRRCRLGVEFLRRRHADRGPVGMLVVSNARVEPWARNAGAGVALYEEAASVARRRFSSMIVAHECWGGTTSDEAGRVWESERFRAAADVYGRAAYGR